MFEPGQTVECIDAERSLGILRRRSLYVVAAAFLSDWGLPAVALEGVANAPRKKGWYASRFRPLPDSRLDVFRNALEPTKEEAT